MRALVLIVICIFLLVALQASYLVIEARHQGKTKTRATDGKNVNEHTNDLHHDVSKENGLDSNTIVSEKDVEKLSHSGPVTPAGLVMDAPDLKDAPIMNVTIKHHEKRGESMGIYEHMLGDAPMPDSDARTHRKSIKKRNRTKHHKQNPGSHNKGKSNKAHSTHFCSQDSDCDEGHCCVLTRKGQQICKSGSYKSVGRRCLSSCVCKDDLQCYINQSHKSKRKPSKHIPFGHCIDPDKAKLKTGYALLEMGSTTSIPTTTKV